VRRAFAVNRDAFGAAAGANMRGNSARRLGWAGSSDAGSSETSGGAFPVTEADADALAALDAAAADDAAALRNWAGLEPDALDEGELRRLFSAMLHSFGLLRRFRIAPASLAGFVADVADHMHDNPFHHFRHAFLVTLTAWRFLDACPAAAATLEDLGVLSLLLAAICHDLEHPGTTNAYQVNTGSALAIRYNDASVLENHHASTGFTLMERAGILRHLTPAEFRAARKTMLAAILATDSAWRSACVVAQASACVLARVLTLPPRCLRQCRRTRSCWRA
jgi:hypothetical protein